MFAALQNFLLRPAEETFDAGEDILNKRRSELLEMLQGKGIEIGALQSPVIAEHLEVQYVDRYSRDQLINEYPELKAEEVVEVHILDDAETLASIDDESQDFVIANHVIEHMRDPIGALLNWSRVLRTGGRIFLAAPDKRFTFDEQRKLTSWQHLVDDHRSPSRDRDFEAFQDFAREVSCKKYGLRPVEESEDLAQELFEKDYSIHYHVWDFRSFRKFLRLASKKIDDWKLGVIATMPTKGKEFIFVLEKGN